MEMERMKKEFDKNKKKIRWINYAIEGYDILISKIPEKWNKKIKDYRSKLMLERFNLEVKNATYVLQALSYLKEQFPNHE